MFSISGACEQCGESFLCSELREHECRECPKRPRQKYCSDIYVYVGQVDESVNGCVPHGMGKLTFVEDEIIQDTLQGTFKDGKLNGQGIITFGNGIIQSTLRGTFKDGKLNGQGTITFDNGTIHQGTFKDGKLNGQGTITFDNGTIYCGMFKNGLLNGQGTITFDNGTIYRGMFKNGRLNGQGTITFDNGTIYRGMFKNGRLNGQGTITFDNGTIQQGTFKNGLGDGLHSRMNEKTREVDMVWYDNDRETKRIRCTIDTITLVGAPDTADAIRPCRKRKHAEQLSVRNDPEESLKVPCALTLVNKKQKGAQ